MFCWCEWGISFIGLVIIPRTAYVRAQYNTKKIRSLHSHSVFPEERKEKKSPPFSLPRRLGRNAKFITAKPSCSSFADQQLFPYFNSAEYNSLIRCVIEYCAGRLLDKVNLALNLVSLTEETLPFKQSHRS